ncbi:hypothetical protein NECAME_00030 [Necator americanus]|uniref:7TM GPCR serpentine receptor class x (Srx) domain-containing protein n=1 Tax=Necator americanus TaxID=51031 RepID=W2U1C5_NECAM|nr:hypothetical protein NECAME_00030 [Necator americanus]ETN87171.1 hypothetical protein NECAME_00030 [Necator americanus]
MHDFYGNHTTVIRSGCINNDNAEKNCLQSWFLDFYISSGTTVGHVYLVIAWTTRCSQGCTVTLLALNRATAVCSPLRHKRIWNSPWANLIFLFQFSLSFTIGSILIPQKVVWKKQAHGLYIQFEDFNFRARYFIFAYALETFFVASIIIINITMMIHLKRKYRLRKSASYCAPLNQKVLSEKQRQENNLTIVSVFTCVFEIIYYLYVIYAFVIQLHMNTRLFYLLYHVFNDIYIGASAWLILSCSATLRRHLRNQLRCIPLTRIQQHSAIDFPMSSFSHLTSRKNPEQSSLMKV